MSQSDSSGVSSANGVQLGAGRPGTEQIRGEGKIAKGKEGNRFINRVGKGQQFLEPEKN